MKKVVSIVLSFCMVLSFAACGGNSTDSKKDNNDASSNEPVIEITPEKSAEELQMEEDMKVLQSIGDIEVENGILSVKMTIPSEYVGEGITQEELDSNKDANYISAKLNDDGSVTYKMTRKQYDQTMQVVKDSIDQAIQEMINGTDYDFKDVKIGKDYSEFNVYMSDENVGLYDLMSVYAFYAYGGMYNVYSGMKGRDIIVNLYGASGALLESYNSKNLK